MDSLTVLEKHNRLIVLLPDSLSDEMVVAQKIRELAAREKADVLFLTVVDDEDQTLSISSRIEKLKTIISGYGLMVSLKSTEMDCWLTTLEEIIRPGDVIVCQEEQTVINSSFKPIPISDFLSMHLNATVYNIPGFNHPYQTQAKKRYNEFFSLMGFLVIMVVFTWLEIRLDQGFQAPLQAILVLSIFCLELGTLWAWYKMAYR